MTVEPTYSKRELDNHFREIKESLTRIETQTMKTNGRVRALEQWRWFLAGGMGVLVLLLPYIIKYMQMQQVVQASIR